MGDRQQERSTGQADVLSVSPKEELMKTAFQILKDKPQITVVLTRDSVCAGDDCDSPHEKTIKVHSFTDPEVLARETASGYLPNVAGVGHSWICVLNDKRLQKSNQ